MSVSRIRTIRCSFSPAMLVLLFSAVLLLPGGCPQPVSNGSTADNNDAVGQDPGAADNDYQAPTDSLNPDDSSQTDQDASPTGDSGSGGQPETPSDPTDGTPGTGGNPAPLPTSGDTNGDGKLDAQDIRWFVLAIADPVAYKKAFPNVNYLMADMNGDGRVDVFDIDGFAKKLLGQ